MEFFQEKTLIILHGWGSSKEKWEKVKEILEKKGVKVFVPDLPGFKEELEQVWRLDDFVGWVENFIEKHRISVFFLLGHSFGGRVAIKFAFKHPEKLKGLILVSAAGLRPKSIWLSLIASISSFFKIFSFLPGYETLRKIFYKFILRKTDYFKLKGKMKETFKEIIKEDLTPYLSQIKVPTLILWGEKDKITPLRDGLLMKEKIENSELKILPKVGHAPYLEIPERLSADIFNFLVQQNGS